ncbi:hypothetical protein TNCV_3661741 [Trichonephila clavipes]|nr:hypothetical protein TNCV_3661741 [Trichonephila clavipes]
MLLEPLPRSSNRLKHTSDDVVILVPWHPMHSRFEIGLRKQPVIVSYQHVIDKLWRRQQYVAEHSVVGKEGETGCSELVTLLAARYSLQTDHLIGTSALALHRPMVRYTGMSTVGPGPQGLLRQ